MFLAIKFLKKLKDIVSRMLEMRTTNLIFGLFSFLFPKRKRALKQELELTIEKRLTLLEGKLGIKSISRPKVIFWMPYSSTMYLGDSILVSYPRMLDRSGNLVITIDHEISHYIQKTINSNARKTYSLEFFSWLYWSFTGKIRWGLSERVFQEGFATYIAYLTSGRISKRLERGQRLFESGKRRMMLLKDPDILPYVLGFHSYSVIARIKSEGAAIQFGLSMNASEWVKEVEKLESRK
jgi:hypothetical protein